MTQTEFTDKKAVIARIEASDKRSRMLLILFVCLLIALILVSLGLGHYYVPPSDVVKILSAKLMEAFLVDNPVVQTWSNEAEIAVIKIRLPRILAAVFIGAALSVAGAVYQAIFRNPMVSPDILGAASGASFGAILAIFLGLNQVLLVMFSFLGGVLTVLLVLFIARQMVGKEMTGLILTGILIGSLLNSAISIIKLLADPYDQLPSITYWLMGSLSGVDKSQLYIMMIFFTLIIIVLLAYRWRLNILVMGDEVGTSLGVNTHRERTLLLLVTTLLVAMSVSLAGSISWIGLVIPHFARLLFGADNRKVLPASIVMGAIFLLLVDNVSRLLSTIEIPLGILTSFIGAPFYLYLIWQNGRTSREENA